MMKAILQIPAAIVLALAMTSPAAIAHGQQSSIDAHATDTPIIAPLEQELIDLINTQRRDHGRPPLHVDARLMQAAAVHSIDMAGGGNFSHADADGNGPDQRVTSEGYRWRYVAENIGCGQETPLRIIHSWMQSSGHRQNLLAPEARDLGVAAATRRDGQCRIFWTALFADEQH
jgi:uncharacterized protein YkwD